MSLPREPRQKMINMMYLVLTALLALNVSAEILNAFKTVNRSLENTNTTVNNSTSTILKSLEEKKNDPSSAAKANYWFPKAQKIQEYSTTAYSYIQGIKNEIIQKAGGDAESRNFKADNLDIVTRMMIDKGMGKDLLKKLSEYKTNVLKNVDLSIDTAFGDNSGNKLPINLETPKTQSKANNTWERAYFHMVPTVAALTILSKFQNDIRTSENRIVQFCHNKVGEVKVVNDAFAAIAVANANYVMPGQKIQVTAGVGGFSTAVKPEISIEGNAMPIGPDGTAQYELTAGTLGEKSINIHFVYTDQDGNKVPVDKVIKYTVGQASASIALDKMNVLYVGVDNPITVAASGGGDDKVSVAITSTVGTISKVGSGKYNARVNSVSDECFITVSVDGKVVGSSKFRTRTIPKPAASVGGFESGENVPANIFKNQAGIFAGLPNFPFQLDYRVASFTISADDESGYIVDAQCEGNRWNTEAQGILNKLKSGRTVTIDDIYATGPDGKRQHLPSLVYYIK